MNHAIWSMFEYYKSQKIYVEEEIRKNIFEKIILNSLSKSGFFNNTILLGDSALSIVHNLPMNSYNLEFVLINKKLTLDTKYYKKELIKYFLSFGIEIKILYEEIKNNTTEAFLISSISSSNKKFNAITINLKIYKDNIPEIETNSIIQFIPTLHMIKSCSKSYLFSQKVYKMFFFNIDAKDWYVLVWFVSNNIELDLNYLKSQIDKTSNAIEKVQYFKTLDSLQISDLHNHFFKIIDQTDFDTIKVNIEKTVSDKSEVNVWSKDFFKYIINDIKFKD